MNAALPVAPDGDRLRLVVFAVGDVRCALPSLVVRELLPLPRLWRPPGMPRPLEGFMNLGGEAVPVVALDRLFGIRTAPTEEAEKLLYRHAILVAGGHAASAGQVALLVDRALDVVWVPRDRLRPVERSDTLNGCVEAEVEFGDGFVHLLDADRILLEQERAALAELGQAAQDRLAEWTSGAR